MFLIKIWIFDFNFSALIAFIIGIIVGFILLLLIYAIMVVASLGNKKFIIENADDPLELNDVKAMVEASQASYKDKELRGKKSRPQFCYELVKDLIYGIAYVYSPKSKYPIFELTIEEIMLLTNYISKRVDDLLDRKGVRLLKKLKASDIMSFTKKTNEIMNNEIVKGTIKASKFKKVIDYLNVINPYKIFKIQVIDRIINLVIDKLCLIIIAVAGEETYKIYSKKAFSNNNELTQMIDGLIDSMDSDMDDAKKELSSFENNENEVQKINDYPNIEYRFKSKSNYNYKNNYEYESTYSINYLFKKNNMEANNEEKE